MKIGAKLIFPAAISLILALPAFSQDVKSEAERIKEYIKSSPEEQARTENMKEAFEKAMRDVDTQKIREQEQLTAELKDDLKLSIEQWIHRQSQEKAHELNRFVKQDWYKLSRRLEISPVQTDYYLRDFEYIVIKGDILKTDSLSAPYKAHVSMNEILYLEKNHAASISYRENYFYTVSTPVSLILEFRNGRFEVTSLDKGMISFTKGVPLSIEAKIKKQNFN